MGVGIGCGLVRGKICICLRTGHSSQIVKLQHCLIQSWAELRPLPCTPPRAPAAFSAPEICVFNTIWSCGKLQGVPRRFCQFVCKYAPHGARTKMAMNGQGHRVPHAGDVCAHARADGGPGACCGPVVPHGQRVRAARAQARALRAPDAVSAALAAGRRGHEAAIDSGERECSSPTDSAC